MLGFMDYFILTLGEKMKLIEIKTLLDWINETLQISKYQDDYSPNGLQVEGKKLISRIITGVTANESLLRCAVKKNADVVLVHHGWFWKNQDICVKGIHRTRLTLALENNINILAYHLPLDAHISLGNNIQLAHVLKLNPWLNEDGLPRTFGKRSLLWVGYPQKISTLRDFSDHIKKILNRPPLVIGRSNKIIKSVAWCTGAAQDMFIDAIEAKVDAFITGEISEHVVHLSKETDTAFIAAGHHATERYGIQALGNKLQQEFSVPVEFIDIHNPV